MPAQRPIGYWIKVLDQLIEADLTRTLTPFGLSRRHWQILNLVEEHARTSAAIAGELDSFVESSGDVDDLLDELTERGWLQRGDEIYGLTTSGIERLSAARTEISAARQAISEGLTREAYETTISTLETMCRNLGWTGPS